MDLLPKEVKDAEHPEVSGGLLYNLVLWVKVIEKIDFQGNYSK